VSVPPDVSPEKVAFIFREIQVRSASMIAFFGVRPERLSRQGMEAGGHGGCFDATLAERQQVGLFALLPAVVDAVRVPVVGCASSKLHPPCYTYTYCILRFELTTRKPCKAPRSSWQTS
jgi:hypothetical protein